MSNNDTTTSRDRTVLPRCPECGTTVFRVELRPGTIQCPNVNRCGLLLSTAAHDFKTGRDGRGGRYTPVTR